MMNTMDTMSCSTGAALESNDEARLYFLKGNRHTRAAYRRALRDAGVELPSWVADKRNVTTKDCDHFSNVTTKAAEIAPSDDDLNALYGGQ
ncbi:hypothetical protein [Paraburkholderia sp. 40]|uniref:hypothetical protein n=1 Tax=Paraburkholderia sp. 40 TaxID=2991059 RepID=UPI003D1FE55B